MGFRDQLNSILEYLPPSRQTMLFSATQTKSIKDLARLSLRKVRKWELVVSTDQTCNANRSKWYFWCLGACFAAGAVSQPLCVSASMTCPRVFAGLVEVCTSHIRISCLAVDLQYCFPFVHRIQMDTSVSGVGKESHETDKRHCSRVDLLLR